MNGMRKGREEREEEGKARIDRKGVRMKNAERERRERSGRNELSEGGREEEVLLTRNVAFKIAFQKFPNPDQEMMFICVKFWQICDNRDNNSRKILSFVLKGDVLNLTDLLHLHQV